jgi:hypothetical protein
MATWRGYPRAQAPHTEQKLLKPQRAYKVAIPVQEPQGEALFLALAEEVA